jgi:nitrous oxide reductase
MFGMELKHVNEAINRNREKFIDGVDILDLKGTKFEVEICDHEIMTKNAINASKHIYLLSEKGLMNLCTLLNNPTAWSMFIAMRDNYFTMRAQIENLSPARMILYQAQQLVAMEERQLELERKQRETDMRVSAIEGKHEAIEGYLVNRPDRKLLKRKIDEYARTGKSTFITCFVR